MPEIPNIVGLMFTITGIFAAVLLINFFIEQLSKILIGRMAPNQIFGGRFFNAIEIPLRLFIWLMGIIAAVEIASIHFQFNAAQEIYWIKNLGITCCLFWLGWKVINYFEEQLVRNKNFHNSGSINAATITLSLKIILIFLAALMIMQTFDINISGLVALGGIGGVVVGFASKDLLSSLFGATLIYFDQPFLVGDWIRSPDRQIEGIVEHIGWRLTTIRTFDKRLLYVPNSTFSTLIVENPSRMVSRRYNEDICLRNEDLDKVESIVSQIKNMLENNQGVDVAQNVQVHASKLTWLGVEIHIDLFTTTKDWLKFTEIRQEILLKIGTIINHNKAQMAVPYWPQIHN